MRDSRVHSTYGMGTHREADLARGAAGFVPKSGFGPEVLNKARGEMGGR